MSAADLDGEVLSTQGECPDCSTTTTATTRERSFDELAKSLADGKLSRRGMLRMLGGALLGGALASIPGVAWATHKPGHGGTTTTGPCRPGEFRCGPHKGKYVCCPEVASCVKGQCVCPNGGTLCPGNTGSNTCVDSTTDPLNCGSCGSSCAAGEGCCNRTCNNLSTALNCGSCGNACSGGKTCQGGVCACPQGQTECGGVCRDLATDVANCGLCGNACAQGASCVGGKCQCPSGKTVCGGQCVEVCALPKVLNTNCQCECPANEACTSSGGTVNSSTCECECPGGKVVCNGACVAACQPPQFLNANCQCECPTDETCNSTGGTVNPTTCECQCPEGKTVCGGQCVEVCAPPKVVLNTNTCQCECPPDETCTTTGGTVNPNTCQCECGSGLTRCGNQCVNTATDPNNCGGCGTACASGEGCVNGTCSNFCPNQMTGCCACYYTNPTTLHRIYTCTGATVGSCITRSECEETCQATTPPPGYVHGGVVYICERATSNEPVFCHAFGPDPRFTGVTCGHEICAPTGSQCPSGQTPCGGQCVNVSTDPNNCGTCGNVCATGTSCVNGQCGCPTGTTLCGGQCVPSCTGGQVLNPTTCQCECPIGASLINGECVCPTGTTACGRECVSTSACASTGGTFNPTTCQCENCPTGTISCGGNASYNPPRCVNPTCIGGNFNPTTCNCECAPGFTGCDYTNTGQNGPKICCPTTCTNIPPNDICGGASRTCGTTPEGTPVCAAGCGNCRSSCTSSSQCSPGFICVTGPSSTGGCCLFATC
jgi:hypothetical protein